MMSVTALGASRRNYYRRAIAEKVKRMREEKGWSQEKLAERLRIDKRQVVRLESAEVPVTLEAIEALAIGLETYTWSFLVPSLTDESVDSKAIPDIAHRIAADEFRSRFGDSLDRGAMRAIFQNAQLLDDEQLWALLVTADALFKSQVLEKESPDEFPRLLPPAKRRTSTRRSRAETGKR